MDGGCPWPFAERSESGPRTGVVVIHSNGPRFPLSPLLLGEGLRATVACGVGNISRRNLHRATNDAYDAIGFLVGSVAFGRGPPLVRSDLLREDVTTRRLPADPGPDPSACAAILVIGPALVVLSDHGSSPGRADPLSPV